MNFQSEITQVLNSRLETTDMLNVVDVLNYTTSDFQKAFDIALELENRNLVKLIYSNYNANKVVIEFTLLGKSKQVS